MVVWMSFERIACVEVTDDATTVLVPVSACWTTLSTLAGASGSLIEAVSAAEPPISDPSGRVPSARAVKTPRPCAEALNR